MKTHPTKKSINNVLPRFDDLRRWYMFPGETGWAHGSFIKSAWADLDDDGNVEDITVYGYGDGMAPRHYYNEPGTVDITDAIVDALKGDPDCSCKAFRAYIIEEIQDAVEGICIDATR